MTRVLHIATGLESGGAEMILAQLVARTDSSRFESHVLSLSTEGPVLGKRIRDAGATVEALGYRRGVPNPGLIRQTLRRIRQVKPHVIQTWMYHADLIGGLAGKLCGIAPVVWGVHHTTMDPTKVKSSTRLVARMNSQLSHNVPRVIVCCSDAAREIHADMGYAPQKLRTIWNGVDTEEFKPDQRARETLREDLGLSPSAPLIGLVARFGPQKDHETFFQAASLLHARRPDVNFVLAGPGIEEKNDALGRMIDKAGVRAVTHLLGLRPNTVPLTAALDIATLCSSYGESFGIVLAEAMACGVLCVTTDLPGPVSVVAEHGSVVTIGDSKALSAAWFDLLTLGHDEGERRRLAGRRHVEERFSLERMVRAYEALYEEIAVK